MHVSKLLTAMIASAIPAYGLITVDFFTSNDCSGDPAKSTEVDPGSNQFTCIKVNNDYSRLRVTGDDSTTVLECGPFYSDSGCSDMIMGSQPGSCDCLGYTPNVYFQVEQEL